MTYTLVPRTNLLEQIHSFVAIDFVLEVLLASEQEFPFRDLRGREGGKSNHMSHKLQWPPKSADCSQQDNVTRFKTCEEVHAALTPATAVITTAAAAVAAAAAVPFDPDTTATSSTTTVKTGKFQSKPGYSRMWEDPVGDRNAVPLYNRLNFSTVPRKTANKKTW